MRFRGTLSHTVGSRLRHDPGRGELIKATWLALGGGSGYSWGMRLTLLAGALLLFLCSFAPSARGDEVVLNNGRSIRGKILRESSKEVVVELEGGQKLKLPRSGIKEVIKSSPRKKPKPKGVSPSPAPAASEVKRAEPAWGYAQGQLLRYQYRLLVDLYDGNVDARIRVTHDFEVRGKGPLAEGGSKIGVTIRRVRHSEEINGKVHKSLDSRSKRAEERPDDKGVIGAEMTFAVEPSGAARLVALGGQPITPQSPEDAAKIHQTMVVAVHEFLVKGLLGTFPASPLEVGKPGFKVELLAPDGGLNYDYEAKLEQVAPTQLMFRLSGRATTTPSFAWGKEADMKLSPGRLSGVARFALEGHLIRSGMTIVMRDREQGRDARVTLKHSVDLIK